MKNSLAEPTTGWSSSHGQLWPSPPRHRQGREDPRSVVADQAGARAACRTKKSGYFNRFSRNQEYNQIKPNITPLTMCSKSGEFSEIFCDSYPKTSFLRRSWTQRTQSSHLVRLVWTPGVRGNPRSRSIFARRVTTLVKVDIWR